MATVSFTPGQQIGRGALDIFLVNSGSSPVNAAEIYYAMFYVDPSLVEVLVGPAQKTPVNPQIGEYYAALNVPMDATLGNYRIRWYFREHISQPLTEVVQEFVITTPESLVPVTYSASSLFMMNRLRGLLRDQNPDKFYHFRPPEYEGSVGKYNRVFGQIWEDAELFEYLSMGLDWFNMFPPLSQGISTLDILVSTLPAFKTAVIWMAASTACWSISNNWVADEFDYSIGGVSLTLEKSSKYLSQKQEADAMAEQTKEAKLATMKFIRGLQQPRFGMGVRSAFGPFTGRGVLSPRNFV